MYSMADKAKTQKKQWQPPRWLAEFNGESAWKLLMYLGLLTLVVSLGAAVLASVTGVLPPNPAAAGIALGALSLVLLISGATGRRAWEEYHRKTQVTIVLLVLYSLATLGLILAHGLGFLTVAHIGVLYALAGVPIVLTTMIVVINEFLGWE